MDKSATLRDMALKACDVYMETKTRYEFMGIMMVRYPKEPVSNMRAMWYAIDAFYDTFM